MEVRIKYLKQLNLCFSKSKRHFIKQRLCPILLLLIAVGLFIIIIIKFKYNYINNFYERTSISVSVIMPCYNSEIYLPNLFLMFKSQTLENFELIFIDDGSTDNTNLLISEQLKKDKRIKLITLLKNTGAGNARNVGLKHAKGEYIIFLDSDDIFYPNLLSRTYKIASKYNVDILVFDFECRFSNNISCRSYRNYLFNFPYPINEVFSPTDIPDNIFTFSRGVPWNKLFKRDFVIKNNLKFLNLKIHNDCFFVYAAYVLAEKIYVINEVLLTYRRNNENSISIIYKNEGKECIRKNLMELKNFLEEKKLFDIYKKSFIKLTIHFLL